MAELEQQVAEHNILQREIEAYGQQLRTLVGPVSAPLSSLVWAFLPPITARLGLLAFKGRVLVGRSPYAGGHHTVPGFSLASFLSLVEAGCHHHQEPIP